MTAPPPTGPIDPDGVDELPDELQPGLAGLYKFPDTRRRRIGAVFCALVGVACLVLYMTARSSPLVNNGFVVAGAGLFVLAAWQWLAAWPLRVDELDALGKAGIAVGFPIGHAAASLSWRGARSRPVWRILLYSAEDPPLQRGIAEIDGVDGAVLLSFAEDNPEDWSAL